MDDQQSILVGSRSWSANPEAYSCMHFMQFKSDGTGEVIYGYGQTIYANIFFGYEIIADNKMQLSYRESPSFGRFAGYFPNDEAKPRIVDFELIKNESIVHQNIVPSDFRFTWELILHQSPFPDSVELPHKLSLTYYGYREELGE